MLTNDLSSVLHHTLIRLASFFWLAGLLTWWMDDGMGSDGWRDGLVP